MEIKQGDTIRVVPAPAMPRMQRLHVGQTGPVIDRYRIGDREQYRVMLPGGAMDFLADEIELLTKGVPHAHH